MTVGHNGTPYKNDVANQMREALRKYPAELDALQPRQILVGLVEQFLENAIAERHMFASGIDPLGKPFLVPPDLKAPLLAAKDRQIAKVRLCLDHARKMPVLLQVVSNPNSDGAA